MSKDFQYGAYYAQIWHRDSNGYAKGTETSPDSVANGTTSHAHFLPNLISWTPPTPTYETAVNKGGQKIRSQAQMGVSGFGTATMELSEFDDTLHSYITGGAVDSAEVTGWRQVGSNVNKVTFPSFLLLVSMKAQSVSDDGTTITDKWSHWLLPKCTIAPAYPGGSQSGGDNPNPLSYVVTPDRSTRSLTGTLFSATNMTLDDDADLMTRFQTGNPITATMYTEAGTPAGTFTTAYKPVTDESTTSDKKLTVNGTNTSITTFNTTTGVVTFTAVTAGDICIATFETLFDAV